MQTFTPTIGDKILQVARAEIGYVEKPGNITKYADWFAKSLQGQSWCAMFVSYCYWVAGKPIPHGGFTRGFAGTQTGLKSFTEKGWRTADPQPGDIVIYDWNGDGKPEHTGIFEKWVVPGKTFSAIEGNTSPKDNSNGGMVMQRERSNKNVFFFHIP